VREGGRSSTWSRTGGGAIDCFGGEDVLERFQKWLFLGDDRNTHAVFVDGRQIR
jgi:hypothetical protein